MIMKQIFQSFITEPDFRQSQRDMGISPAQHLKFLLAQAREDKHFRLDSIRQHQIRFPHYAKSEDARKNLPESLDRSGPSKGSGRNRQGGDRRKQERIN